MSTRDDVFERVRAAAVTKVQTLMTTYFSTVPVQYDNRTLVDVETQLTPWVSVELVWNDGEQASIEFDPVTRYEGALYVSVYTKQGNGSQLAQQIMGKAAQQLKRMPAGTPFQTRAARPVPSRYWKDWQVQTLRVPFYTDDAA